MISGLELKAGSTPNASSLKIQTTPITIFVGPNNSGKSRVLNEIEQFCSTGSISQDNVVLAGMTFFPIEAERIEKLIAEITVKPIQGENIPIGHVIVGGKRGRQSVNCEQLKEWMLAPENNKRPFCNSFLRHTLLKLNGPNRINLVSEQATQDLQGTQHQTLGLLFTDDTKRSEVRRIVYEAFGIYLVVDPTNLGHLRIRLSTRAPSNAAEERGIDQVAVKFHSEANLIAEASDGVKAFTGIIAEVVAGDPSILLIDEPEAFLHPSLSYKLGLELSTAANKSDKRVFVSTHSAAFLMGCIQSGAPVNIVRLTYRGGVATARALPSAEIISLMRNPLLRSTNVLSGLFYESVIVTESDADRAFYQEVNERLLRSKPEWGIPNCLFLHAQNKQTIPTIIKPLRKLGIPAAGIVDVDVLKEGGSVWTGLLEVAGIPDLERQPLATTRSALKAAMDATGKDMKRDGGLAILTGSNKEAGENLLKKLSEYGMFVVPGGELESWLSALELTGHGPQWLIKIFAAMGEDPDADNYLKPGRDDVWKFVSEIRDWMTNSHRKGIPSE
ncbi:ATP-dependent endonuclease [Methylosinus sp. RM1]|uniref:ATP-dependent nuclease n=1 Tax=Methylosinus sp. RM1 TaxID=2583817 RepID=UPI0014096DEF|nr:ATP-binding protein [Methylosinus sp. RM1]